MSKKREIKLGEGAYTFKHGLRARARIFKDAGSELVMGVSIIDEGEPNSKENPTIYGGHFNIETLGLSEKQEDWLAWIIASRVADAIEETKKRERQRVRKLTNDFFEGLKLL